MSLWPQGVCTCFHCPYCEQVVSEQRTDGTEQAVTITATHSCTHGIYQLTAHMVLVA